MYQQQQQQQVQVQDRGYLKVPCDEYPKKVNGIVQVHQGTNTPIMQKKYKTVGEITRFVDNQRPGGFNDKIRFYRGHFFDDFNQDGFIDWESQRQNNNAPRTQQNAGGYRQ